MIKRTNSSYKAKPGDFVLNWGCSSLPFETNNCFVLNKPEDVGICTNKKTFLETVRLANTNVNLPPFTTDKTEVSSWLSEGSSAFARTKLTGHSWDGIIDVQTPEDLEGIPERTLFTKYMKKRSEWRIHFIGQEIVDFQKKMARRGSENVDYRVRNHANGWVYGRNLPEDESVPQAVNDQARLLKDTIGLDFGAIDIIYNERYDTATVLEVNTAPGLEGTTTEVYAMKIAEIIKGKV
jgi:glutathione synthase/RimK-type ligase-like ATP-grasp enzyme